MSTTPEEQRRGVGPDRSGLQPAQHAARCRCTTVTDAVDGAVDQAGIDALPQPAGREQLDRLHDRGVVDLVDVVLVAAAGGRGRETLRPCGRRPPGSAARSNAAMPMPATATPLETPISISSVDALGVLRLRPPLVLRRRRLDTPLGVDAGVRRFAGRARRGTARSSARGTLDPVARRRARAARRRSRRRPTRSPAR